MLPRLQRLQEFKYRFYVTLALVIMASLRSLSALKLLKNRQATQENCKSKLLESMSAMYFLFLSAHFSFRTCFIPLFM